MELNIIETNYSILYLLPIVAVSGLITYLLYPKDSKWSNRTKYILSFMRFISLAVLLFFLIEPIIKTTNNAYNYPHFVIAIDDSKSIKMGNDSTALESIKNRVNAFKKVLEKKNVTVDTRYLSQLEDSGFEYPTSNLSGFLSSIEHDYEGLNLQGGLFITDGLYNKGISPEFQSYSFPINILGIGDTIPKLDARIKTLKYNKIVYQGNKFPMMVTFLAEGMDGAQLKIEIAHNNTTLHSTPFTVRGNSILHTETFLLDANKSGMQHYSVHLKYEGNEFSKSNNRQSAYIDMVEGKEKILMLASGPHPDLKAIKSALETKSTYQIDVYWGASIAPLPKGPYDLVIAHDIDPKEGRLSPLLLQYQKENTPIWWITNKTTNFNWFSKNTQLIQVSTINNKPDKVNAYFNEAFSNFNLTNEFKEVIGKLPPLEVPFAEFETNGSADVLLYQQVGNVRSSKPLLVVNSKIRTKEAVLLSEGLWLWKLQEYAINQNSKTTDELILKMVQFLSSKEDKRKFRFYSKDEVYNENSNPIFETEIYNDLYERIYNKEISLSLTDEQGNKTPYSFVNTVANSQYEIPALKEGIYQYAATTKLNGLDKTVKGEFIVQRYDLEALTVTSDFNLLRRIASQNQGLFYTADTFEEFIQAQEQNNFPAQISTETGFYDLINFQWIFYAILLILSLEWFLRKYHGYY